MRGGASSRELPSDGLLQDEQCDPRLEDALKILLAD
jgi:hypothetical protein